MVLQSVLTSITFADGSEATFAVRVRTAEYFGINQTSPKIVTVQRRSYSYYRCDALGNKVTDLITVPSSRYSRVTRLNLRSVREVRVPTEFVSPKGNVRTYGINFPVKADYVDISHWLFWNCKLHKPIYFLTEAGKKRMVYDWSRNVLVEE